MGRGRASKKLIVDHDKVSSSVYAVESNDDLLIQILLRLPAFSLVRFKSVSKRWLSLITDPVCTPKVKPPSGLIFQRYTSSRVIYDYLPFDTRFLVNRSSPPMNTDFHLGFPSKNMVEILQSCNGLLLFRSVGRHCVFNPSVNRCRMLPSPCNYTDFNMGMRLAFDPIKSPYYKLVFGGCKYKYKYNDDFHTQIQTYSSETGTWSICPEEFPISTFLSFFRSIYWNNGLHWIDTENKHLRLDVENLVLTTIQAPRVLEFFSKLFESRGCLLLVGRYTDDNTRHLGIYEMSKGYCGWSMKYLVNLDDINMKLFSIFGRLQSSIIERWYNVHCMVLGEKEEDSFLVMETCEKVVQYKIVLETVRELYDWGILQPEVKGRHGGCYQYYASFAGV